MDKDTKIAVDMDIEHIEELYGKEGLVLAIELIKEKISVLETKYCEMEE